MTARKREDRLKISVTIQVGDAVMTVTDSRPIVLSGDRRRWRSQITEAVAEQTVAIGNRFAPS